MYKIAVCDDDTVSRREIVGIINEIVPKEMVQIKEYSDGTDLMYDIGEKEQFDIIMLDISMDKMDGITAAKQIREGSICSNAIIFFITSYQAEVVTIVDVNPMAYIYKPIRRDGLEPKIRKAINLLDRNGGVLEIVSGRSIIRLKIEDIMYIESYNRGVEIHTSEGVYRTATYKIGNVTEQIWSIDFIRCHNSFIVNKNFVKRMDAKEIQLYNGEILPISRKYHDEILGM